VNIFLGDSVVNETIFKKEVPEPYPFLMKRKTKLVFRTQWKIALGVLIGISIPSLIFGIVVGVTQISRQLTVESCHNWAVQTGRDSKFISQNFFSYGCFTTANDGKWVGIDSPQQFIPMNVSISGKGVSK